MSLDLLPYLLWMERKYPAILANGASKSTVFLTELISIYKFGSRHTGISAEC